MAKDSNVYVVGHLNPDTDSICAAIAYAHFLKEKTRKNVVAARAGSINNETKFALKHFNVPAPKLLRTVTGKNVIIVDHNEVHLALPDIRKANILEIIDHHRIGDVETIHPIEFINEPRGSTASIIAEKYSWFRVPVTKKMAGMMLSALISDTILLNSPTTTKKDRVLAKKLAEIAEVNVNTYGRELLEAGCDLINQIPGKVILTDFKEYINHGSRAGIGQVNIADTRIALKRRKELLAEMERIRLKHGFAGIFLMVTNIVSLQTDLLVSVDDNDRKKVEKIFRKKIENGTLILKNTVSRKKQIQPKVLEFIEARSFSI